MISLQGYVFRVPANREIESGSPNHVIVAHQLKKSQQPPEEDEEQDTAVDENDVDSNKGTFFEGIFYFGTNCD